MQRCMHDEFIFEKLSSKVQLKFLCLLGQGAICGGYFYRLSDNKKCLSGVFEP